jgi:hypothetical protein
MYVGKLTSGNDLNSLQNRSLNENFINIIHEQKSH